jgi:hypothetical protein
LLGETCSVAFGYVYFVLFDKDVISMFRF